MKLNPLFKMQLHYTWIDFVDYGAGGQYVGTIEGTVSGDGMRGTVKAINVPAKRPDNVNCPAFRGVILTDDGVKIYLELNGIAVLRPEDKARVFTTSLSLRTGDARYRWLNDTVGVAEGILNTTTDEMMVRGFTCENQLAGVSV